MTDLSFSATYLVATKRPSRLRPLLRLAHAAMSWVPSYRDTRKGRAKARTIRVALMATGITLFALVENDWRLIGIPIAATSLILPLAESRKRSILARLKLRGEVLQTQQHTVTVSWDGKRLDVGESPRIKRVLTKPGQFDLLDEGLLTIASKSRRKAETIRFGHDAQVDVFCADPEDVGRLAKALRSIQ